MGALWVCYLIGIIAHPIEFTRGLFEQWHERQHVPVQVIHINHKMTETEAEQVERWFRSTGQGCNG